MERDESRSFPSSWISRLSSGTEKRCLNIDSLSLNSRMGFVVLDLIERYLRVNRVSYNQMFWRL
jgi:hypothetical protein